MSADSWLLEDFIEYLPIGVLILNKDLQIQNCNEKAIEYIGIFHVDLLVQNLNEIQNTSGLHEFLLRFNSENTESTHQVIEINGKFISCYAQKANPNGLNLIIVILKDASVVNSLETIRRDYISTILHSIRTPLATLTNSLNILNATAGPLLIGDQADALTMSISEVIRLNTLLEDLKELFYIESGLAHKYLILKQYSVQQVLDRAFTLLFQTGDYGMEDLRRIIVNGDQSTHLSADLEKMAKSFFFILENALHFSNEPVEIIINKHDSFITIDIKDHGIGISENTMPHLFSKFFREDNQITREHSGYGLSLFFVKSWIELMNGSIMCESKKNQGSVFSLTLEGQVNK